MRVTTAFKRLLRLDGVNVTDVIFGINTITVTVALVRRRLVCPHCGHQTSARYDTRPVPSRWRHLDLGVWKVQIEATLRRLCCPTHGVVVEAVPFARAGAHLTADLDDLLAWLATRMDKTSVARLCRVSWRTVGRACGRVVATSLDPGRLDGLFRIGVDEISWRKHHKYLTLVVDHDRGCVVWGAKGKDSTTLDGFFDELGSARAALIEAVSLDLGPAFPANFGSVHDARAFCHVFFEYYNNQHYHSAIALHTPATVHHGRTREVQKARAAVLDAAFAAHPERFSVKPNPLKMPTEAWINDPSREAKIKSR